MRKLIVSATLGLVMPLLAHADGIPGMRGPDHVGLTVPDLQQAVTFFTEVIGCKAYTTIGPFKADDDWMDVRAIHLAPLTPICRGEQPGKHSRLRSRLPA